MIKVLHGLNCDRKERGGYFLVLSRDPSIARTEFVSIEQKMLLNCTIPGLLPPIIEETDLQISLLYEYTSKRPLTTGTRMRCYSQESFARIVIGIASIIENSHIYMLSPHRFVLDPAYIYSTGSWNELELLYLPLKMMDDEPSMETRFSEMVILLATHINWQGKVADNGWLNKLQTAENYLECKKMLLASLRSGECLQTERVGNGMFAAALSKPLAIHATREEQSPLIEEETRKTLVDHPHQEKTSAEITTQKVIPQRALGIIVTIIASVWLLYGASPLEALLFVALGISLLGLDLLYALWKFGTGGPQNIENKDAEPLNGWLKPLASQQLVADFYAASPDRTVLLENSQATVLLRKPDSAMQTKAFLEYDEAGIIKRISIESTGLLLGRDSTQTIFMKDDREISRHHAEITLMDNSYLIRDLGSKNGTCINGDELIPLKETLLAVGDKLTLSGHTFVFQGGV
ncbi:MAG: FHA domain-containing protein [Gorillibacterium sp.]|nr:FHA domain-containing protein [Gorillibacterium sp.]